MIVTELQGWARSLSEEGISIRWVVGPGGTDVLAQEGIPPDLVTEVDVTDAYAALPLKTLSWLEVASREHPAQYFLKVDDDVFVRFDRLPAAARQWTINSSDYVGCMKQGPVVTDPLLRWREPQAALLGPTYFTHAWGPAYALSAKTVSTLTSLPKVALRYLANEDTSVGLWVLATGGGAVYDDDRRLCETACSPTALAVYDYPKCAGLCRPAEALAHLLASPECSPDTGIEPHRLPPLFHLPHAAGLVGTGWGPG
ncbi:unnamed protein product [Pedinophyceae sp. YPF-701]|nr:unnamed protein product [Pedinophyceae sp. YPF-701]